MLAFSLSEQVMMTLQQAIEHCVDEEDWPGRHNYIEKLATHIVAESEWNASAALTASETHSMKHEIALLLDVRRDIGRCISKIERP
eukprot:11331919-Ditylum_brightwellii.AAC.1